MAVLSEQSSGLFPLPAPVSHARQSGNSRRARQRHTRHEEILVEAAEVVSALNSLFGVSPDAVPNAEYGEAVECLKEAAWLAPPASRHTVSNALRSCRHKLVALSQERESQKHVPSMVRTLDFEGTEGLQEAITTIDAIAWNDESPVREARALRERYVFIGFCGVGVGNAMF